MCVSFPLHTTDLTPNWYKYFQWSSCGKSMLVVHATHNKPGQLCSEGMCFLDLSGWKSFMHLALYHSGSTAACGARKVRNFNKQMMKLCQLEVDLEAPVLRTNSEWVGRKATKLVWQALEGDSKRGLEPIHGRKPASVSLGSSPKAWNYVFLENFYCLRWRAEVA